MAARAGAGRHEGTAVGGAVLDWGLFKEWLGTAFALSHREMHVGLGLLIFLLAGRLLRRPMSSLLPLYVLLALETGNELLDFAHYQMRHWRWSLKPSLYDLFWTMLWPVILLVHARWWERRAAALRDGEEHQ